MLAKDFGGSQGCTYAQKIVGKSPGLLPTEWWRRRVVWHPLTGPFKNLCLCNRLFCFFQYNHCLLSFVQQNALAQLVTRCLEKPKSLGSIPRSPYLFNIIFFYMIRCSCVQQVHHMPSAPSHQIINKADPMPSPWRSIIGLVKLVVLDLESQRG